MSDDNTVMDAEAPVSAATAVGRRFGDQEIHRILQKAAELQERSQQLPAQGRGLTLEELRQVAMEAGIDPRYVDLAAADATGPLERRGHVVAGGPYRWHFQQRVPGSIVDADRERILREIRTVIGQRGELADVFGRMEWSHDDGLGPIIVGISSRDGVTEVDVSANRASEIGLMLGLGVPFGGMIGGAILAAATGVSGPAALMPISLAAAAVYAFGRAGWRLRAEAFERRLERLVERITSVAQEASLRLPSGEEEDDATSDH